MSILGFVSNFYNSPNKFEKHYFYFDIVPSLNKEHLDDTFVLYSPF